MRALFAGLPLFFMVLCIAFATALMAHGLYRMLVLGLPVCSTR